MDTGSRSDPRQTPGDAGAPVADRRSLPSAEQPAPRAPAQPQPQPAYPGERPFAPPGGPHPPTRGARRHLNWLWLVLGVLVVGAIVWFALHQGGGQAGGPGAAGRRGGRGAAAFGGMPTTVSVAQATRGDMPIYLNELGSVTPLATVTVQSQISGYLLSLGFKEGQMVRKGQFLAQIDPRPYQAQLLQAEGALARDQASLAEAQLDLKRYQTLLAQDSIARQTVDQQAALVQQDLGTVKTDQASIATAKLNVAYTHITSPVAGRVGLRQVDVGNYVTPGLTNGLVVVTELTPIDVEFTLPEDNLPEVASRVHSGATLPVTAFDRTGQTELAQGQLLTLDNVIDPTTGTVKAKARFGNEGGTLFPQQFVNVRILVDTLRNTVLVPSSAILRGSSGLFVYVVQGGQNNHTAAVRNVKTGPAAGDKTAILDGVQPGETVITDGTDRLRDGSRVILPGDCIPSFGSAGAGGRRRSGGAPGAGGWSGGAPKGVAGQHAWGGAAGGGNCPKGQRPAGAGGPPAASASGAGAPGSGGPGGGAAPAAAQPAVQPGIGSLRGPSAGVPTGPANADQASAPGGRVGGLQGGGSYGQGGGRMQGMLAGLGLSPAQQQKAQAIFAKARAQAMSAAGSAGDDPDARRAAMRQAFGQAFAQLNAILTPAQKAKLSQMRANMAFGGGQGGGDQGGGDQGGDGQP